MEGGQGKYNQLKRWMVEVEPRVSVFLHTLSYITCLSQSCRHRPTPRPLKATYARKIPCLFPTRTLNWCATRFSFPLEAAQNIRRPSTSITVEIILHYTDNWVIEPLKPI